MPKRSNPHPSKIDAQLQREIADFIMENFSRPDDESPITDSIRSAPSINSHFADFIGYRNGAFIFLDSIQRQRLEIIIDKIIKKLVIYLMSGER